MGPALQTSIPRARAAPKGSTVQEAKVILTPPSTHHSLHLAAVHTTLTISHLVLQKHPSMLSTTSTLLVFSLDRVLSSASFCAKDK